MVKVKICGITRLEDARVAARGGADFLGFVFYPKSPRHVSPEQVREIVNRIKSQIPNPHAPRSTLHFVGVFVDQEPEAVWQVASGCGLDYVQLHGAETPEAVTALRARGLGVIKAFRVHSTASLADMEGYRASIFLLDTHVHGQPGGTGRTFDWSLAQASSYGPILLAGGLHPGNVAQAVRTARPWGVDVSSGVETQPGRKDPDKIQAFIDAVRREMGERYETEDWR